MSDPKTLSDMSDILPCLKPSPPTVSLEIVVDARLPVIELARALAKGGLCLINTIDGKFCLTNHPEDWRP